MARQTLHGVVRHVRCLAALQATRLLSDHELLAQFLHSSDEPALTALIERHAQMVLGVCRRALGCPHDAEDACQATFLVLSRKAGSIRKAKSLSSWLHGVALRVAGKLKRERARRALRERRQLPRSTRSPADDLRWAEVQAGLDEELERLPERYKSVLILCYLDGKTRDEAAKELQITPGALHGLLERGRKMLADRLTRRGLTLSAGLLAIAVSEGIAGASWSPTQIVTTVHAATLFAAGQPVGQAVSAGVLSLAHHVLKGMIMTKLKVTLAAFMGAAFFVGVVGLAMAQTEAEQDNRMEAPLRVRGVVQLLAQGRDTDEAFIRRVSKDLRGIEPTPAEIHFFKTSTDPKRREKLIDLFVAEREAKKKNDDPVRMRVQALIDEEMAIEMLPRKVAVNAPPEVLAARTDLELARLSVREKEIRLQLARARKLPDLQAKEHIELAEIELRRARLRLEEAEQALRLREQQKLAK